MDTVTLLTANAMFETRIDELVAARRGIRTGELLSNRNGTPGVPVGRLNGKTVNVWSHCNSRKKLMGVPQTNAGEVLTLKGTRFVPEAPARRSG